MRRISVGAMLFGAALIFGVAIATEAPAQDKVTSLYWRCAKGLFFEVNGDAVHCIEAGGFLPYSGPDAGDYPMCPEPEVVPVDDGEQLTVWVLTQDFVNFVANLDPNLANLYVYPRTKDVCTMGDVKAVTMVGGFVYSQEAECPPDFPQHVVSGPDECARYARPVVKPPTEKVVLRTRPRPQIMTVIKPKQLKR